MSYGSFCCLPSRLEKEIIAPGVFHIATLIAPNGSG